MNVYGDERLKNMLIKFFNRVFSEKPDIPYSSNEEIEEMFEKKILKYLEYICEDYDVEFISDAIDEEDDMIRAIDYAIKCDDTIFLLTIDLAKEITVSLKFNNVYEPCIPEKEMKDIIEHFLSWI
jgi:hypothetical protein